MSGLAAAHELRREGLAVTVMEQRGDVGGQWLYDPRTDGDDPLDTIRLNTRVMRVSMAPREARSGGGGRSDVKWQVRTIQVDPDGSEEVAVVDEVFNAVVVANGHHSQPRLPKHQGYQNIKDPFRDEVVVVLCCGESGLDIAIELRGVAKEVHLTAKSVEEATTPAPMVSNMLANHADIRLLPPVHRLCEDGTVLCTDSSRVVADTVIYGTGYTYSFPFLNTGGCWPSSPHSAHSAHTRV
ncbi:hypothetical protein BAE44_0012698 [Dichanthelium oligosanthes]|uniref:FAD/NAD(P)-binding domain-containing protein n=1 Tax=Dichanthelium oligosanthes TaxID=888268 RepID=A0A1E5VMD0_9POAL|nr:hypothetical protein BAE44_0012698 [Dichanthelium oligosanthes]